LVTFRYYGNVLMVWPLSGYGIYRKQDDKWQMILVI